MSNGGHLGRLRSTPGAGELHTPAPAGNRSGVEGMHAGDRALAARCAADQHARNDVFRAHVDMAYRLAHRILGDPVDAEDVVQDVFVLVFKSIDGYRGDASLRNWIARITVRACWRYAKRARRRRMTTAAAGANCEHAVVDGPALVEQRDAARRLELLLARLKPRQRMILVLHHLEGYSLAEAADLMEISLTAAKKLVWRGRRDLARIAGRDEALDPALRRPK